MSERDDDRFRPRPGKPKRGGKGVRVPRRFTSQVLAAGQKTVSGGRLQLGGRKGGGAAFGRGRAAARLLPGRIGPRARRVVVKARLVVLAKAGPGSTAAHLRYVRRDGVTPDGEPGRLYAADVDRADAEAFEARGREDRHQFRFIVSPEDATELGDLQGFTRDMMRQVEADLGTRLDWVAVDHWDTDNPHTHLVVRGVDAAGADLIIARDYIAHGMRLRASALATDWLGRQTEREVRDRMRQEMAQERWTGLDRRLAVLAREGVVDLSAGGADARPLLAGRLQTLERLGLAVPAGPNAWTLRPNAERVLREMGERGDIIRTMQSAIGEPRPLEVFDAAAPGEVVGKVAAKGLADELTDRGYLVVDGIDGRARYVALPAGADLADYPTGAVVAVRAAAPAARPADRTIAELAGADRVYRPDQHLQIARAEARSGDDPEAYVAAHVRRLEALRRAGAADRLDAARWRIPPDFLARAAAHDAGRLGGVRAEVLCHVPVQAQARAIGATWLDRALLDGTRPAATGFGAEVAGALEQRRETLIAEGLAQRQGDYVRLTRNLLAALRGRELVQTAEAIVADTGLKHRPLTEGGEVRGVYRRQLQLVSGRFAMLDDGVGFSLVPWRPVLERRLGQSVAGVVRAGGDVNWSFGRTRAPAV